MSDTSNTISEIAFTLLKILANHGVEAYEYAVKILSKKDPTPEDYLELANIVRKSSEGYFAVQRFVSSVIPQPVK